MSYEMLLPLFLPAVLVGIWALHRGWITRPTYFFVLGALYAADVAIRWDTGNLTGLAWVSVVAAPAFLWLWWRARPTPRPVPDGSHETIPQDDTP